MKEAYRLTRKDGAPGIDGVTAADYAKNLEANLLDLLDRIKLSEAGPDARRAFAPVERSPGEIANRTPMRQQLWRRPQLFRPSAVRGALSFHAWPACSCRPPNPHLRKE
jgi:hypothetical protein